MKNSLTLSLLLITNLISFCVHAQLPGRLSGDLQLNANFYLKDSAIGAANTPQYNKDLSSVDSWLSLNYSIYGFTAGIRFDLFNNSPLFDPSKAFTGEGIGYWYISKEIKSLTITGGYFYEQFGSGIAYRSYEDRGLGVDYATFGVKLDYKINDKWKVKAFTGQQKDIFSTYKPIIKGVNIEGLIPVGKSVRLLPGASFVNRTIDDASMNLIVSSINLQPLDERFNPMYNVYVYSGYNTLIWKNITWYAEYTGKTHEAILNNDGMLIDKPGNVAFTTLTYSVKGFGITGQFKRTDDFVFRTSPNEILLNGVMDYLPSLTRQNTLRLLSRYNAATQYLGEMAYQGDAVFTPAKGYTFNINYSYVQDLNGNQLWQEIYGDIEITKSKKVQPSVGLQTIYYDQAIYENKPGVPVVRTITPFAACTYKLTKKKSLRAEVQYMDTRQDYGSWLFGLLEFNVAPRWSLSASDMYNIMPNTAVVQQKQHYFNFFASFTQDNKRLSVSYVRQVEGYDCTGGVCRYEPAFSGVRCSLTANF